MSNNAEFINPPTIAAANGYTHVVKVRQGNPVYIAGQIPLDKTGSLVGKDDLRAQTEQVFKNLQAALEAAGATFEDVVKLGLFLTDISQIAIVREVRNNYINVVKPPASTAVEVRHLFRSDVLIEIEAIAILANAEQ